MQSAVRESFKANDNDVDDAQDDDDDAPVLPPAPHAGRPSGLKKTCLECSKCSIS